MMASRRDHIDQKTHAVRRGFGFSEVDPFLRFGAGLQERGETVTVATLRHGLKASVQLQVLYVFRVQEKLSPAALPRGQRVRGAPRCARSTEPSALARPLFAGAELPWPIPSTLRR